MDLGRAADINFNHKGIKMAKSEIFRKTIGVPPHGKSKFVQKGSTTANVSTKAKTQSLKQTTAIARD
jgi:hypothetical protein